MSLSTFGALDNSYAFLLKPLKHLDLPEMQQKRFVSKIMTITIHSPYYVFCRRDQDWKDPDLMDF